MYLPHRVVSREFRDEVAERLPGLKDDYHLWRLLEHILFGTWIDDETGMLVLSAKQAAYLVGEEKKWLNHRFKLQPLLDDFACRVFPLDTEGVVFNHWFGPNRAGRVVARVPEWLIQRAATERRRTGGDLVEFATGAAWTRRSHAEASHSMRFLALEAMKSSRNAETTRLLEHLNGLPSNSFASIRSRMEGAHELVDEIGRDTERQHNLLKAIEQFCQPLYQPVDKSVRVYSVNESYLRLKREVRDCLTAGWMKADLRSAQLAIVAAKWGCTELREFLSAKHSVWPSLLSSLGVSQSDENKAQLKEFTYALVFGMSKAGLRRLANEYWPSVKNPWTRLTSRSVLAEVLHARTRQFELVRRDGFTVDAFGRRLTLASRAKSHGSYQGDSARSVLAQVAQSWELALMLPILDMAEQNQGSSGFRLMMWLHDGVAIHVPDTRRRESWRKRIGQVVDANAMALGIPTSLEWS